jgi:hypothetical protein
MKKPKVRESVIQRTILDYLEAMHIFCWRQNQVAVPGRRFVGLPGVPDIIGILPGGRFFGVEVKAERGKQSKAQKDFEMRVKELGGVYVLAYDVDDVLKVLAQAIPTYRRPKIAIS